MHISLQLNSAELEANTGHHHGRHTPASDGQHQTISREVPFYHLL
ncbi:hypothetical protein [Candidatus Hodgkinia cicadicola]